MGHLEEIAQRRRVGLSYGLALIFDLDGVVVDSMPIHTLAWQRYLAELGIAGNQVERRMHGRRNDEIVRDFLGPDVHPQAVFEHGTAKERLFREMISPQLSVRLVPGVVDFLARSRPTPIALATNAEPANVDFVLNGTGIRSFFSVIVDGTQVAHAKPAPDVYLRAAELMTVDPANCIVFEDSPVGVAAARAAGMRVVGVLTHEPLEQVDYSLRDFRDSGLDAWLAEQRVY
jgi:beta-phosphoglucomutase family hydrolase